MADFTKAYCNLHPHQQITNFCIKEQCLVGLCANCICTHTQCHVEKGTSPHYQNIRTTCKKMQETLQIQIQQFDESKERIATLCEKVQEKRQKLHQLVDLAKSEAITALETYFQQRRNKMIREIEAQEKQAGLHCENRLQSLLSSISRQSSALIYAIDDINSSNFLESLPRIRTQTIVNAKKFHDKICEEIQENQNFKTSISFHKGFLQNLGNIVDDVITIQFSLNGKQTFIKAAENSHLKSSRVSSNKQPDYFIQNLNKNTSITFRLQQDKKNKQNVHSQINFGFQRNMQSVEKREAASSQQKFYQTIQPPPHLYHNNRLNQTHQSFKYPNFLSQVPRATDNVAPLGIYNMNGSRANQDKISMSNGYRGHENTYNYQYTNQDATKGEKTTNLGKKSRKSGLRVVQTHQSETEYSRDQNENQKHFLSRGSLQ